MRQEMAREFRCRLTSVQGVIDAAEPLPLQLLAAFVTRTAGKFGAQGQSRHVVIRGH